MLFYSVFGAENHIKKLCSSVAIASPPCLRHSAVAFRQPMKLYRPRGYRSWRYPMSRGHWAPSYPCQRVETGKTHCREVLWFAGQTIMPSDVSNPIRFGKLRFEPIDFLNFVTILYEFDGKSLVGRPFFGGKKWSRPMIFRKNVEQNENINYKLLGGKIAAQRLHLQVISN